MNETTTYMALSHANSFIVHMAVIQVVSVGGTMYPAIRREHVLQLGVLTLVLEKKGELRKNVHTDMCTMYIARLCMCMVISHCIK